MVGRWHEVWLSAVLAAVAAVTGNVVVLLFFRGHRGDGVKLWPVALLWLLGAAFAPIPALQGVLFSRLGAAVGRSARSAPVRIVSPVRLARPVIASVATGGDRRLDLAR